MKVELLDKTLLCSHFLLSSPFGFYSIDHYFSINFTELESMFLILQLETLFRHS